MTELPTGTQTWIGRPAPRDGARLRLFCLPYAGGGTTAYRPWIEHLPADIELCTVRLPGREMRLREKPYTNMDDLVVDLSESIEPLLDRPYALFGHSMGAWVAFALAHQLRRRSSPQPIHLFVSGRRAPQLPEAEAPLHQLPDADFVAAMVRRYDAIPQVLLQDVALLRLFLPALRADMTMIETYRYAEEPPLRCPIAAFGGWEDRRATQAGLSAWRDHSTGAFALRMFPGGHFFIQSTRESLVEEVVRALAVSGNQAWLRTADSLPGVTSSVAWMNPPTIG